MHRARSTLLAVFIAASLGALPAGADLGEADRAFGTQGSVVLSGGTLQCDSACRSVPTDLLRQPDGKLLVGAQRQWAYDHRLGYFMNGHVIYRTLAGGSLDTSFGSGGLFIPGSASRYSGGPLRLALHPDGRIYGAFRAGLADSNGFFLRWDLVTFRLDPNGALDPSYGAGGYGAIPTYMDLTSVALQQDGALLVGGFDGASASSARGIVVRFRADGTPDPAFGVGGVATVETQSAYVQLAVQSPEISWWHRGLWMVAPPGSTTSTAQATRTHRSRPPRLRFFRYP